MERPSILKISTFHFLSGIQWRILLLYGLLYVFLGGKIAYDGAGLVNTFGDFYFLFFSGPDNYSIPLMQLLLWFIPQMLFYYLIGNMAYGELSQNGYILLPRIGSRKRWWLAKVISLLFISAIYLLELIVAPALGAVLALGIHINSLAEPVFLTNMWPSSSAFSGFQLVCVIVLLYLSSMWFLGTFQMAISLIFKQPVYSFLLISAILLVSCIGSVNQPGLVRWLLGAQTILSRHSFIDATIPGYSLLWSLVFNLSLFIISFMMGNQVIRRLDITRSLPND
ncbi:hypothetical protein KQH61_04105 [bacterium]|nr:hypothetical protein [bacterium]MCB2179086.1 hypothetical protein [bacterium]